MIVRKGLCGFLLLTLLYNCNPGFSQEPYTVVDMAKWTKMLSSKNDADNQFFNESLPTIFKGDSTLNFQLLKQLQARLPRFNQYYKARVNCFTLWINYNYRTYTSLSDLANL